MKPQHFLRCSLLCLPTWAGAADVTDPGPVWLFPSQANVQATWRPGLGLPGQAAPERPLVDLATQDVTVTSLGIRSWTDHVRAGELTASERHAAFWTETLVPLPNGGLVGFDAYDLREGLAARDTTGRRETFESPSGIRFGGAWDLLYPFVPSHAVSWGIEAWVPAWSVGETSLRSGLRLGSSLRADFGAAWRRNGVRVRQDTAAGWSDTLEPGSLRRTLDLRVGARVDSLQFQIWGGWKRQEPRGDSAAWRQRGEQAFGGLQAQGQLIGLAWELEGRYEKGFEAIASRRWGGEVGSRIKRTSRSASLRLEPSELGWFGQPRLTLECASLDLFETFRSHPDSLGVLAVKGSDEAAGASAVQRFGWTGQIPFFWKAFRLAPELGWHRISRQGELPSLWSGGLGNLQVAGGAGQADLWVPGFQVTWKRSGSLWNYQLRRVQDVGPLAHGWQHDILLSQSF